MIVAVPNSNPKLDIFIKPTWQKSWNVSLLIFVFLFNSFSYSRFRDCHHSPRFGDLFTVQPSSIIPTTPPSQWSSVNKLWNGIVLGFFAKSNQIWNIPSVGFLSHIHLEIDGGGISLGSLSKYQVYHLTWFKQMILEILLAYSAWRCLQNMTEILNGNIIIYMGLLSLKFTSADFGNSIKNTAG